MQLQHNAILQQWRLLRLFARLDLPSCNVRQREDCVLRCRSPSYENAFRCTPYQRDYVCMLTYDDALLRVCILPLSQRIYFVSFEYFVDKMACVRAKHRVHHAECIQFSNAIKIHYKFYIYKFFSKLHRLHKIYLFPLMIIIITRKIVMFAKKEITFRRW